MTEVLPYWHPDSPLGLKTTLMKMNETGTLKLVSVPGGHMDLYWTTIDYIAQFLNSALPWHLNAIISINALANGMSR